MTQKEWNGNTKVTDSEIIMMHSQIENFNSQIRRLKDAKNRVPENFGITKANYFIRLKQLKESGVIESK